MLDVPWEHARHRRVATFSGGEQQRFALEMLLRGPDEVLLLEEPDNYLDVPGQTLAGRPPARDAQERVVRQPGKA